MRWNGDAAGMMVEMLTLTIVRNSGIFYTHDSKVH